MQGLTTSLFGLICSKSLGKSFLNVIKGALLGNFSQNSNLTFSSLLTPNFVSSPVIALGKFNLKVAVNEAFLFASYTCIFVR